MPPITQEIRNKTNLSLEREKNFIEEFLKVAVSTEVTRVDDVVLCAQMCGCGELIEFVTSRLKIVCECWIGGDDNGGRGSRNASGSCDDDDDDGEGHLVFLESIQL